MTTFLFNGINMTQYLDVAGFEVGALPQIAVDAREVSGRDGTAFMGTTLAPLLLTVEARLAANTIEPSEIQREWARVASLLRTAEPAPLSVSPGIYRMAVLSDETPLEFQTYSATAKLQFYCPDPVAYGATRAVEVPSGGSATFVVSGTYPTRPAISAPAAVRDASALAWQLRLDDGDYLRVETGTGLPCAVELDCRARTCKVAGATRLPTLDSDWLVLEPGEHTVANDLGTGACTLTYAERWL